MDQEIKDYLEIVQGKLMKKDMLCAVYIKEGKKLTLFAHSNNQVDANNALKAELKHKFTGTFVRFNHTFNLRPSFFKSPFNITCEIYKFVDGKKVDAVSVQVFYMMDELYSRGYKIGDFRKIINKVSSGEFLPISVAGFYPTARDIDTGTGTISAPKPKVLSRLHIA